MAQLHDACEKSLEGLPLAFYQELLGAVKVMNRAATIGWMYIYIYIWFQKGN